MTPDGDVALVQYPGANWHLSAAHCADLPECDVLLLQGEVTAAASERAGRVIRSRGGIVVLNPAPVGEVTPAMLDAATAVCPNEVEARALSGADGSDPLELARRLVTPARDVVVTLGAAGAVWASGSATGSVTPPSVTAVDATGAGDSFCAALALALAEGQALAEAVRFACAAGAWAATVRGAEPGLPTRDQARSLLTAAS